MRRIVMMVLGWAAALCALPAAQAQQVPVRPASPDQIPAQSTLVQFPGSGWWLAPPQGFVFTNTPRPAFRHPQGGNIQLIEGKRTTTTVASISADGPVQNAGTATETRLEGGEVVSVGGLSGVFYRLTRPAQKIEGHILQLDGRDNTVTVAFNVLPGVPFRDPAAIRQVLLTLVERPLTLEQRLASFPVNIGERAGMRFAHVAGNLVAVLTEGPGNTSDDAPSQPLLSINALPLEAGTGFEPRRDRAQGVEMAKRFLRQATFSAPAVERTSRGDVLSIPYTDYTPTLHRVAGMVWIGEVARHVAVVISQHPPDQPQHAGRMLRIRDGITARAGDAGAIALPSPPIPYPGTSWSIAPPPGFALVTNPATMFRHPDGSFIIMIESPRERLSLSDVGTIGTTSGAGTPNEGRLEAAEQLTVKGRPAILMRLKMPRRAMANHTVVIEGEHGNVSVSLAIPDRVTGADPAAIRAALLSTTETPRSADQRLGDAPFRLTDMAGMRVAHIIANSVVVLTDGPGNQMDEATSQSFAMISQFPQRPGERFDAGRDVTKVAAQLRQQYPNATILTQSVERTAKGPVAAVTYRRTPPGTSTPVAGAAWAWESGGNFMFFVAQHPVAKPEQAARLARVRDGMMPK
ncbi:MAG: hypothetical protein ACRCUE_01310 [Bosea sp. (in: a-proteobacteria)]